MKSLNLPKRQRYVLMAVFGLGGIICLMSIIRFHSLYAIAVSDDPSWDNPLAALWAVLEATVGIIASCLPTMKGLVTRYLPHLFSGTNGSRSDVAPHYELSRSRTNKSDPTVTLERAGTDGWDTKPSEKSKRWRKSKIRVHEVETSCSPSSPTSPRARDFARNDGIKVTTVVEQVERRKQDWDLDDQEKLVPAHPRNRF